MATWNIETVAPISDPTDANWGRQYSNGDGSTGSPYGSVQELLDSGRLGDGDTIILNQPTKIPTYGAHTITNANLTILPGNIKEGHARWVNGYPIDITTQTATGSGFDVYRCATGALDTSPTEVTANWNGPVNGNGHRYGVLDEVAGANIAAQLTALETNFGWAYDAASDTLYVSIPTGESISAYEFIVGLAGDTLLMNGPRASYVRGQSFEHAFEAGTGNGYGLRCLGECRGLQLRNNNFDGTQYHSYGAIGTGTRDIVAVGNICRTTKAGNDSHEIWFSDSSGAAMEGIISDSNTYYIEPWLTPLEAAFETGTIKAIAIHTAGSADPIKRGGIRFRNPTVLWRGVNAANPHIAFAMTAGSIQSEIPTDPTNHDDYAIQIEGMRSEVAGFNLGSSGGTVAVSLQRSTLTHDGTSVISGLAGNGRGHVSITGGNTSASAGTTYFNCEASTFVLTLGDVANRCLFSFAEAAGSTTYIRMDCVSARTNGSSFTQEVGFFTITNGLDDQTFILTRCELSTEDEGVNLLRGNGDPSVHTIDKNWYSGFPSAEYHRNTGVNLLSEAQWQSTVDADGRYTGDPVYADADTLKPDKATMAIALEPEGASDGPVGVNNKPYSGRYGAWQKGSVTIGPRTRMRRATR